MPKKSTKKEVEAPTYGMKDTRAEQALARYRAMKNCQDRTNFQSHWRDIAQFFRPEKDGIYDWKVNSTGQEKHIRLYDSSGQHYSELLACILHTMLSNPSNFFFGLASGDRQIDKIPSVREYMQETVRVAHEMLNNSNFQSEIHEVFMDIVDFGTAWIAAEEDEEDDIRFFCKPIFQIFIEEDAKSIVRAYSAEERMTVRSCINEYGDVAKKALYRKLKNMDEEVTVIHLVIPRDDYDPTAKPTSNNKPIAKLHILEDECCIIREGGYDVFPAAVPRWMKLNNERYGRSPAMKSLPNVRLLNAIMKTTLRGAQKVVDPPLMVPDDSILGRVNTAPGGLIPYRAGTEDRVFPLVSGARPDIGKDILEMIRSRIKEDFYIDQLQLRDGPQMTATEVNQRTEEQLRLLGPILGRLHYELLQPLVARILDIMRKRGKMPPNMPPELEGRSPIVFFTSQIARVQKMSEVQNFLRFLEVTKAMVDVDPAVYDYIDTEGTIGYLSEVYGAPQVALRSPDEVQSLRSNRAASQQSAEALQSSLIQSQIAKNVSGTVQQTV